MINLIPNTEKKEMIKNFYYRLAAVSIFALGIVMLIASVALTPSYFLSSVKKSLVVEKLEAERKEPVDAEDLETLKSLSVLDGRLSMLEKSAQNRFIVTERVINEILLKKVPDIKITQISFEKNDAGEKTISIRGSAGSRDRLLLFRRALEDDPLFKKVDLPISNFVKGSNIQFYLSLIPS